MSSTSLALRRRTYSGSAQPSRASAHSTSDAYLTMEAQQRPDASVAGDTVIRGQWDIALRDLHFVLRLDDDGDGNITWGELRRHIAEITRYAYPSLRVSSDGKPCAIDPVRHAVSNHADGAYVALFFDIDAAALRRG